MLLIKKSQGWVKNYFFLVSHLIAEFELIVQPRQLGYV